ncbi:glycoside hydrolase family 88 protein [Melioribacter sp. Ez-97]|uniref:glycoside hydrolase family 88 protein n=1 Tax=Melioribacter sp. Ez-97 TaxID=3423434 RepID=UPI003ED84D51
MIRKMLPAVFYFISVVVTGQNFAGVKHIDKTGNHSESYQSLTFDGAWCWFSDPRAVYYEGNHRRTYAAWVDSYGDVIVGYYDHDAKKIASKVLEDNFEIDDHDNPSLLFMPDGRLMVFFTKHSSKYPILLFTMKNPEDISSWERKELHLNDEETYKGFHSSYTYANPVMLSAENNRIYLFWRGIDYKPNYSYSDDMGKTWRKSRILILPERIYNLRRPYLKIASNGKDKIAFAFTDGHPRNESENSVYYMYYKKGAFYDAENNEIGKLDGEPVKPQNASVVYDAKLTKQKAWVWDVALDREENPVIVYSKFPDDSNHVYCYARWNKKSWNNYDLVNSGKWFPETPDGAIEREPNYSGGISIDHENPNVVYLSVKRDSVFEIEKWTLEKNKKWIAENITKGSSKNNVRPVSVLNADEDNPLQVLWMQNTRYVHYTDFFSSIKMNLPSPKITNPFNVDEIKNLMRQAADWQLANPIKESKLDWHYGAFYIGLEALYETVEEDRYLNEMINVGQKNKWRLLNHIFNADRLTIADVYVWLYEREKNPEMIDIAKWVMDIHKVRTVKADPRYDKNNYRFEWWTWCDALFMAPPSFARMYRVTGDSGYLKYAIDHWWITSDYLYSKEDSLFYRDDRFFDKKSENGEKIFWCRGNGWVIAGLARMLNIIPKDDPSRPKFENQFKEMAHKLLSLQREHGLWTASLYDPEQLPMGESSGSAFYTYALAWGINNGLLDKAVFEPAVKKAWKALCANVNEWGRLGYVQQVAGDPYPFYENQWQVYATGAFLLCGKEMITLLNNN